jgi:DNA-binding NarL/FixJ family response regulator
MKCGGRSPRVISVAAHLHLVTDNEYRKVDRVLPSATRVVLADDHASMLSSLRSLIESERGIHLVGETEDLVSTIDLVCLQIPDVLVLGLSLPYGFISEAIHSLREAAPATQIGVASMKDDPRIAKMAIAAGALAWVLKEHSDSQLPQAIRAGAAAQNAGISLAAVAG